jgi:hypothetical protein
VLLPLGAALALRAIPLEVMAAARAQAQQRLSEGKPVSWVGAVIVGAVWVTLMGLGVWWVWRVVLARP